MSEKKRFEFSESCFASLCHTKSLIRDSLTLQSDLIHSPVLCVASGHLRNYNWKKKHSGTIAFVFSPETWPTKISRSLVTSSNYLIMPLPLWLNSCFPCDNKLLWHRPELKKDVAVSPQKLPPPSVLRRSCASDVISGEQSVVDNAQRMALALTFDLRRG